MQLCERHKYHTCAIEISATALQCVVGAQTNGSFEPLGALWLRGEVKWLDHAHKAIDRDLL
jgi:hypothetical protein